MVKKLDTFIFIMIMSFGLVFLNQCLSFSSETSNTPIFDGSADPDLRFSQKGGGYVAPDVDYVYEYWEKFKWTVRIDRWFFKSPAAITKFVKTADGAGNACYFTEWDKIVEIGDRTKWLEPGMVVFSKGKVLVKVFVVIHDQISDEQKKEYTKRIAKSVAKKL